MTDALPFPGLAGGLVRPGDVLVRLEDPRKAPSDVDVTEASFDFIEKIVSAQTPRGAVTATFARWEEDDGGFGEFLATRYCWHHRARGGSRGRRHVASFIHERTGS